MGRLRAKGIFVFHLAPARFSMTRGNSLYRPQDALSYLDRALAQRDSALARLIRADIRTRYAQVTGRPEDADNALDDVRVARALLPDSPATLMTSLDAQLVVACCYERALKKAPEETAETYKSRHEAALQAAKSDAAALKDLGLEGRAVRLRILYYDLTGDDEAIRAEYLREKAVNGGAVSGTYYFFQLYRQRKFDEALEILDHMPKAGNESMYFMRRIFTLVNLPDGPARALKEYGKALEFAAATGRSSRLEFFPTMALLLLGQKEKAEEAYHKIWKTAKPAHFFDPIGWPQKQRQHLAGLLSTEELLATAGASQWYLCEANFQIGVQSLADGDRKKARRHFQASVDTRVLWFLEYAWSRTLLAVMDADPAWPSWLPVK